MAIYTDIKASKIFGGRYLTRRIAVAMAMEMDGATEELIPFSHRVMTDDKENLLSRLITDPLFVNRRQNLVNKAILKKAHGAIMISCNKSNSTVEATTDLLHPRQLTTPIHVTNMNNIVIGMDAGIPTFNHYFVHLCGIKKRAASMLYDIAVTKMMVARKPSLRMTNFRHGIKMLQLSIG